jgi:hypothetical protein
MMMEINKLLLVAIILCSAAVPAVFSQSMEISVSAIIIEESHKIDAILEDEGIDVIIEFKDIDEQTIKETIDAEPESINRTYNTLDKRSKSKEEKTAAEISIDEHYGIASGNTEHMNHSDRYDCMDGYTNITRDFKSINTVAAKVSEKELAMLESNPNIKRISIDREVKSFLAESTELINATKTWQIAFEGINLTGIGQSICIIDTGVDYRHPDLGGCTTEQFLAGGCSKVIAGYDFVNEDDDPIDDHGHGTHVAGIAAADGSLKGVAKGANIVAIKALGSNGGGSTSNLIAGIIWCVDNSEQYNITVISMSLGIDCDEYPQYCYSNYCDNEPAEAGLAAAVNAAAAKNITVVAAAGNSASPTYISTPACLSNVTAITASTKADTIAAYSNRNSLVSIIAPGSNISSTIGNTEYTSFSGTSMATPHAAGAYAIMQQYYYIRNNRKTSPESIKQHLISTGELIFDAASNRNYSRIDLYSAIMSIHFPPRYVDLVQNPAEYRADGNYYFNVSWESPEIDTAILNFNGTNYSMLKEIDAEGKNYYKTSSGTFTIATGTAYTYYFYANDTFGNSNTSALREFEVIYPTASETIANMASISLSSNSNISRIILPTNSPIESIVINSGDEIYLDMSYVAELDRVIIPNQLTLTRNSDSEIYTAVIQPGTIITAQTGWNQTLLLPSLRNSSLFTAPSGSVNDVIEIGSEFELNFSKPVKIIIGGMAGKRAAWTRGTQLTAITTQCNSATAPTNINSITQRECYIDSGDDLVIWTYHFTNFAAYTPAPAQQSPRGGGGGGGGLAAPMRVVFEENIGNVAGARMGSRYSFTASGAEVILRVRAIRAGQADFQVEKPLIMFSAGVGQNIGIDLSGDGNKDFDVRLDTVRNNNEADFRVILNVPLQDEEVNLSELPRFTTTKETDSKKDLQEDGNEIRVGPEGNHTDSEEEQENHEFKDKTKTGTSTSKILLAIISGVIALALIVTGAATYFAVKDAKKIKK